MTYTVRPTPRHIPKPGTVWWARPICWITSHRLAPTRGEATVRCLRCKDSWP